MVSSTSKSPKKISQLSKPITRSMMKSTKSQKTEIPTVVRKLTARMRTMPPGEATKGKQLGAPFMPMPAPPPKRRRVDSYDLEDEDPEDDPDNEYGARKLRNNRADESDEEGMGENYLGSATFDESDEEERGDEDRRSLDDTHDDSLRSSDAESFTPSDDEDTATYDGYDSD